MTTRANKVVGWGALVLGVLIALNWEMQVSGRIMQGLTGPPFDLGNHILSLLLGGVLILGGWRRAHQG